MKRFKTADDYFKENTLWPEEVARLRRILLATDLQEEVKWGGPCYTFDGKNIVGVGAFKSYFGLWFHQGALLKDDKSILINAQEGKTRALRQWRMTRAADIKSTIIKSYVKEAIGHAKQGKEIKADRSKPVVVPIELQRAMRRHKGATAAFKALRHGLQREYADYIAAAKRDETKQRRIDKILPMISAGKGLHDKYRS